MNTNMFPTIKPKAVQNEVRSEKCKHVFKYARYQWCGGWYYGEICTKCGCIDLRNL